MTIKALSILSAAVLVTGLALFATVTMAESTCITCGNDDNGGSYNNDQPICISCEGGVVDLGGAATTVGTTAATFEAPEKNDHLDVSSDLFQLNEGESFVDLTIGTDGTFDGVASARQLSYGGATQTITNMIGGNYSAGIANQTYAGAATLLESMGGDNQ